MLQLATPVSLPATRAGTVHRSSGAAEAPPKPRPSGGVRQDTIAAPLAAAASESARTVAKQQLTATTASPPVRLVPATPLDLTDDVRSAPRVDSLFTPNETRAIVAGAVATRRYDGDVDVPSMIRELAQRRPLERIPREARASVQLGCQILVDYSPGMEPYAADREQLVHWLRVTVGDPRVTVRTFRGSPLRSENERGGWQPRRLEPVVVISDLGIGGPPLDRIRSTTRDWLQLASRARRARCPIVAFVPFGPKRWNPLLTRVITHVHWDHTTTAGVVRRAIGRGHPAL